MISIQDFDKLAIRVGTIEEAQTFPDAKKPAYKVRIDFGPYGKKWSSAQITENYGIDGLVGRRICAVMNLGKKKIGPFTSEVLIMGAEDSNGHIVLLEPDNSIKNGAKAN